MRSRAAALVGARGDRRGPPLPWCPAWPSAAVATAAAAGGGGGGVARGATAGTGLGRRRPRRGRSRRADARPRDGHGVAAARTSLDNGAAFAGRASWPPKCRLCARRAAQHRAPAVSPPLTRALSAPAAKSAGGGSGGTTSAESSELTDADPDGRLAARGGRGASGVAVPRRRRPRAAPPRARRAAWRSSPPFSPRPPS